MFIFKIIAFLAIINNCTPVENAAGYEKIDNPQVVDYFNNFDAFMLDSVDLYVTFSEVRPIEDSKDWEAKCTFTTAEGVIYHGWIAYFPVSGVGEITVRDAGDFLPEYTSLLTLRGGKIVAETSDVEFSLLGKQ